MNVLRLISQLIGIETLRLTVTYDGNYITFDSNNILQMMVTMSHN